MRFIKGHVDLLGLGHILQDLSHHRGEGYLKLVRGRQKAKIHVGPGGFRLLASSLPRVRRLSRIAGSALRNRTPEGLRDILRKEKLLGWSLGQLALSDVPLRREDVEEALRRQVEEEILDLFVWTQATFEFKEGRLTRAKTRDPLAGLELRVSVTSLLLEAARREDEAARFRQALGDDRLPLRKVDREFHADALGEDLVRADAVLPLITGRRSLRSILQASIYPVFSTLRAIYRLVELGYVERVGGSPAPVLLEATSAQP